MHIYEITHRNPSILSKLLSLWEDTVRATHLFLSHDEIMKIKYYVPQALQEVPHLIIAEESKGTPLAFMGIADSQLEMLFVKVNKRGLGIGKKLLTYGIKNYGLQRVAVNKQNPSAIDFYKKQGFHIYGQSEVDEQGGPYPIVYMKLEKDIHHHE